MFNIRAHVLIQNGFIAARPGCPRRAASVRLADIWHRDSTRSSVRLRLQAALESGEGEVLHARLADTTYRAEDLSWKWIQSTEEARTVQKTRGCSVIDRHIMANFCVLDFFSEALFIIFIGGLQRRSGPRGGSPLKCRDLSATSGSGARPLFPLQRQAQSRSDAAAMSGAAKVRGRPHSQQLLLNRGGAEPQGAVGPGGGDDALGARPWQCGPALTSAGGLGRTPSGRGTRRPRAAGEADAPDAAPRGAGMRQR